MSNLQKLHGMLHAMLLLETDTNKMLVLEECLQIIESNLHYAAVVRASGSRTSWTDTEFEENKNEK